MYIPIRLSNFIRPRCADGLNLVEVSQCSFMHIGFFACFHAIAVVSAESPHYFSCPCITEAVGIAHKPPRSL